MHDEQLGVPRNVLVALECRAMDDEIGGSRFVFERDEDDAARRSGAMSTHHEPHDFLRVAARQVAQVGGTQSPQAPQAYSVVTQRVIAQREALVLVVEDELIHWT